MEKTYLSLNSKKTINAMAKLFLIKISSILFVFHLCSCYRESKPDLKTSKQAKAFFDLESYMEQEKRRLQDRTGVKKKVWFNSNVEELALESFDLDTDLSAFSKADINRPSWAGKYSVDTFFNKGNVPMKIVYRSLDEDLKTQSMEVDFNGNAVTKIEVVNKTESLIANSVQTLLYQPSFGYSIVSDQTMIGSSKTHLRTEVFFNP